MSIASVVHMLRMKAISSAHEPMFGNQSLTSIPHWPYFFQPICSG